MDTDSKMSVPGIIKLFRVVINALIKSNDCLTMINLLIFLQESRVALSISPKIVSHYIFQLHFCEVIKLTLTSTLFKGFDQAWHL